MELSEVVAGLVNWMLSHAPGMGLFLVAIWFASWSTTRIVGFRNRVSGVEEKVSVVEKKVDTMSTVAAQMWDMIKDHSRMLKDHAKILKRHGRKIEDNTRTLLEHGLRITNLEMKIERFTEDLNSKERRLNQTNSPIELTPLGYQVLEEMGGKAYLDEHEERLMKLMERERLKCAMDVQEFAARFMDREIDQDELIPVRDFVFFTPTYYVAEDDTFSFKMRDAIRLMALYLRDKYLKRHPELLASPPPSRRDKFKSKPGPSEGSTPN